MEPQVKGGYHDSVENIYFKTTKESDLFFHKLRKVFLNINCWDALFDEKTKFQVTDDLGNDHFGRIAVGNFVKIKIPGPANKSGGGFDWVRIRSIEVNLKYNCDTICIELQPCRNPNGSKEIAHFFTESSRNYFTIKKQGCEISASVHGRNEVPNLKNLTGTNAIRNFLIANGGIFGLSKIHWKGWTVNILDEKYIDKCVGMNENKYQLTY